MSIRQVFYNSDISAILFLTVFPLSSSRHKTTEKKSQTESAFLGKNNITTIFNLLHFAARKHTQNSRLHFFVRRCPFRQKGLPQKMY